jgi:hypothetical protein
MDDIDGLRAFAAGLMQSQKEQANHERTPSW